MNKMKIISLSLLSLFVSCGALKSSSSSSSYPLEATRWQAELIYDEAVQLHEDSFTLNFSEDNKINVKGACNIMMGPYNRTEQGGLSFENLASTRMACPDMALEAKYMQALHETSSYEAADDKLILMGEQGVLMQLKRVE